MVFISHSSLDFNEAKSICDYIEMLGFSTWICERDLDKTKQSWPDELMNALTNSDFVLVLVTKNSIESGEVDNEISNASAMNKNVIPFILTDQKMPQKLVYFLRKYEWIKAFSMDRNAALDLLRCRLFENTNEEREHFWSIIKSRNFKSFVTKVVSSYYKIHTFDINGQNYALNIIESKIKGTANTIKDFDSICSFSDSNIEFDIEKHQEYINWPFYYEYSTILEGTIRYPNRPGYMLDDFKLDADGKLNGISVHIGTYAENVYSSHILEYELFKAYEKYHHEDLDNPDALKKIFSELYIRNKITESVTENGSKPISSIFFSGLGRESLLSVQMIVIIKSKRTGKYEIKIAQRSNNVAAAPGIYQLMPAGGFEILNDSDDDIYDEFELFSNLSVGCAIFREYLEELFNMPEFEGHSTGSVEDRLLKDARVVEIEELLKNKKAEFLFLGTILDLCDLRQELSFALVIHDDNYSEKRFLANEECKKGVMNNVPIEEFDNMGFIWNNLHGPSAAMWKMFKETETYRRILEESKKD